MMEYRILANTDLKVSRLCFGTMTFGGQTGESDARRMVDMALDTGINFFDTANVYNAGASEQMLGRALGQRRNEVIVASKVGGWKGSRPGEARLRRDQIVEEAEKSLRRLGTEYLDIYYLHMPDYRTPVEESLGALEELVEAGKVRWPATSNYAAWQVAEMLLTSRAGGRRPPWIAQQMYNLIARRLEPEFVPMAKQRGVSIIAYNPLAGGLLTGKHRPGEPAPGTRFGDNEQYRKRYWCKPNFEAVERLQAAAELEGCSLVELALGWLLHHTAADCVILGASRAAHLEQNLKAAGRGPLSGDALAAIEEVWTVTGGVAPRFNR